jgi:tripartite-type tricarboxylate transporter receptor subunit TctC
MARVVLIAGVLALASFAAHGQLDPSGYPAKPVRIIVGFTPGSATDVTARLFAQRFTEIWGVAVTVENTPGAGGTVGAARSAKETAYGGAGSVRLGAWMRPGSGL